MHTYTNRGKLKGARLAVGPPVVYMDFKRYVIIIIKARFLRWCKSLSQLKQKNLVRKLRFTIIEI